MKLYVGNLSYTTTEDTLREAFSNYGDVVSVSIIKDRFTGQSKGFGFVEMQNDIMGERGIGGMNGKDIDGRRLRVSVAVDKPQGEGEARRFLKDSDGERPRRFDGERPRRFDGERPRRFDGERPRRFDGDRPRRFDGDRPRRFDGERPRRFDGERPRRDFSRKREERSYNAEEY